MLLLSPVPMVRGFGVLLVVGIVVALACALTAGSAAMALADRDGGALGASLRGARDLVAESGSMLAGLVRPLRRLAGKLARPGRRARAGVASAARATLSARHASARAGARDRRRAGGARVGRRHADLGPVGRHQARPLEHAGARDLHALEHVTGVSGEIDVVVHAQNVATPKTIGWMLCYEDRLLAHYGYLETKGCSKATLCPALSLPDLFCSGSQPTANGCAGLTAASINALLDAVPPYFSQAVITPRPSRRLAGVRDPADAAVPTAAGDRLHALAAATPHRG